MIYLKLMLAAIAGWLCARAVHREDTDLTLYWFFVMIYWVVNALDQIVLGG